MNYVALLSALAALVTAIGGVVALFMHAKSSAHTPPSQPPPPVSTPL
jgi:hypothetical protein